MAQLCPSLTHLDVDDEEGGFAPTQHTAAAIQALADMGEAAYIADTDHNTVGPATQHAAAEALDMSDSDLSTLHTSSTDVFDDEGDFAPTQGTAAAIQVIANRDAAATYLAADLADAYTVGPATHQAAADALDMSDSDLGTSAAATQETVDAETFTPGTATPEVASEVDVLVSMAPDSSYFIAEQLPEDTYWTTPTGTDEGMASSNVVYIDSSLPWQPDMWGTAGSHVPLPPNNAPYVHIDLDNLEWSPSLKTPPRAAQPVCAMMRTGISPPSAYVGRSANTHMHDHSMTHVHVHIHIAHTHA